MDYNQLQQSYLSYMRQHGRAKACGLIEKVGKASTLDKVAEKLWPALVAVFTDGTTAQAHVIGSNDWSDLQRRAFARFNRRR